MTYDHPLVFVESAVSDCQNLPRYCIRVPLGANPRRMGFLARTAKDFTRTGGGAFQFGGELSAAFHTSSNRRLKIVARIGIKRSAPARLQRIPAPSKRAPNRLQPLSTMPLPIGKPASRTSKYCIRRLLESKYPASVCKALAALGYSSTNSWMCYVTCQTWP
jgi:hypothetical protein